MTIRAWPVVLAATVVTFLLSTWGMALVVFLFGWWLARVVFGGMREGIVLHGLRRPLAGIGEEPMPRADGEP